MWAMLQRHAADDFVVATGLSHSLEQFVRSAFEQVGLNCRDHVDHDPSLNRPNDINCSLGDSTKAAQFLAWRPQVQFAEIVARMVRAESEGPNAVS
jgi:GDPmannose 4,6-dehydratase